MELSRNKLDGILLVDKAEGRTSFETVRDARRILRVEKAGHSGTLDKAASGLLVVCLGRATSVQSVFMASFKRYRATVRLGEETETLDKYGRIVRTLPAGAPSDDEIRAALARFMGKSLQVPPNYSSIHVRGKRSYLRALEGEELNLPPREIEIRELTLLENRGESFTFEVVASKGTYVRSLARDLAGALGTCGYLLSLRRLQVGPFSIEKARTLEEVRGPDAVIPLGDALGALPSLEVGEEGVRKVENGVPLERVFGPNEMARMTDGYTRLLFGDELVAVVEKTGKLRYLKVFRRSGNTG